MILSFWLIYHNNTIELLIRYQTNLSNFERIVKSSYAHFIPFSAITKLFFKYIRIVVVVSSDQNQNLSNLIPHSISLLIIPSYQLSAEERGLLILLAISNDGLFHISSSYFHYNYCGTNEWQSKVSKIFCQYKVSITF